MSQFDYEEFEEKKGISREAKVGIGCGVAVVLLIVLICGGAGFFVWRAMQQIDAYAQEFEQQGYRRVDGHVIEVTSDITQATVYAGQIIEIRANSDASIALACQVADINGRIDGDVDFFGQVLIIERNAHITGNVNVRRAQVVEVRGRVDGEITGSWQVLEDHRLGPEEEEEQDEVETPDDEGDAPAGGT